MARPPDPPDDLRSGPADWLAGPNDRSPDAPGRTAVRRRQPRGCRGGPQQSVAAPRRPGGGRRNRRVLPPPAPGPAQPPRCGRRTGRRTDLPGRGGDPARRTEPARHGRCRGSASSCRSSTPTCSASRSAVRWWRSSTDRAVQIGRTRRASEDNERNSVLIRTPDGVEVVAVQIAGLLARRIVCDVKAGDKVTTRRHLRPDPVRVAAGHLPSRGLQSARDARPAGRRRRDDPGGVAVMKPRVKTPVASLRMLPSAMTVAGDLPRPVGGQVRARRPADRGDGVPGASRRSSTRSTAASPGCSRPRRRWARRSTRWPTR